MNNALKTRTILLVTLLILALALPASAFFFGGETEEVAAVSSFAKNGTVQNVICFSQGDFVVEQNGNLTLDSIILTSLPSLEAGILKLGDAEVAVGDQIAMSAVSGLRFYPLATPTVATTSFVFTPVFSNGTAGEEVTVGLYLLTAENNSPIAENLDICTYKNVAITGRFAAVDPEGDLLTYKMVKKPARGAVMVSEDGSGEFVYTPYENKTGKDSFTYVAVDAVGNTSEPATVKVRIVKASTKVNYSDMDGNPAHKASIRLAEEGIFIGECMDGQYFFNPDAPVTRSAFVAMAMKVMDMDPLADITTTGFADDASIPAWSKPYISSALKSGVVQGYADASGQIVFSADAAVTKAEAAVLLNRMLQVSDVKANAMYSDSVTAPVWAYQSAVNLESVGVIQTNSDGALALDSTLTRAEAAEMLSGVLDVLDSRETSSWFNW
ncbi:hypothetical protein SDC9_62343 [bioreactor metagenome]|uniref:SLH domain-containing protein n=1 Tax=bioreactor metagenome TaxID=1076179 RepID=A0A644XIQ1_9ZZZZ